MKILAVLISSSAAAAALPIADIRREAPVDFGKELYPILKRNCLACHNTTKAKAGLNLESPEAILKGGDNGPAAVAGRSAESLILKTATHAEDPVMPPAGNKVNAVDLTSDELGLLKLWIDQGARGDGVSAQTPIVWRGFPARAVPVSAAAVSPGGVLTAAARGNQVEVIEVATGVSLGFLADPKLSEEEAYRGRPAADRDAVMSVAFGSEELMATGGYRTARLWRRAAFRPLRDRAALPEAATALAGAGSMVAAGDATGRVVAFDASLQKPDGVEFKEQTAPIRALAVSPDGGYVVSASEDKAVRVLSLAERAAVFRAESPVPVTALAFVDSGRLLAAAGIDGVVRVYTFDSSAIPAETPPPVRELKIADKGPAFLVAVDPSASQVAWGTGDAVVHVLDASTGQEVRQVTCEHPGQPAIARAEQKVQAAQRHFDGRKARAAAAGEAAKKDSDAARAAHEAMEKARADWQRKLEASGTAAAAVRALPDDKPRQEAQAKAVGEAQAAERAFLNARTNAELGVRLAGQALSRQIAAEAAQSAAQTALTEAQATLEAAKKPAPFPAVKSAVVLRDRRSLLLGVEGGRVQWHSLESGALVDSAEWAAPMVVPAGDGMVAVGADKKPVLLPERRVWHHERTLGAADDAGVFGDRVITLAFSSDARLLATGGGVPSRGGEVKLWNVADGAPVLTLKDPHSDTVNALAFSPDDEFLGTAGSDRWARVFRVADGERIASFEGHSAHVLSIAWRGDGLALATGGADKSLRTWDLLDAKQIGNNTSFGKEVSAVGWLGTGDTVVSASGDTTVRLNDERLPGTKGFAFCLATDRAGQVVAAGGEDGVLRVWRATEKKLLREFPLTTAPAEPR